MPDATIYTDGLNQINELTWAPHVFVRGENMWVIYCNNMDTVGFIKSENRGVSFGSFVTLIDATTQMAGMACHKDGDDVVHIAVARDGPSDGVFYRTLNLETDGLTPLVTARSTSWGLGGAAQLPMFVTTDRDGNIIIGYRLTTGAGNFGMVRSSTGLGGSWSDLDFPWTGGAATDEDWIEAFPDFDSLDNEDLIAPVWDESTAILGFKKYISSIDTWSAQTSIRAAMTLAGRHTLGYGSAALRNSDKHILFVVLDDTNGVIRLYDMFGSTVVELTNVETGFSGTADGGFLTITIDQATDDIYVGYGRIIVFATQISYHTRVSRDDGVTWEAEVDYSTTSLSYRQGASDPDIRAASGGRFAPILYEDLLEDGIINLDIPIDLGAPVPPPAPPPPVTSPGGSFNRPLSGGAAGFLTYITPDGISYPFHTPHDTTGRFVLSFSGFGTPPIEYITQRSAFQHGQTVKDFFLTPRVLQVLIRHSFANRTDWWAGRAALLDDIRPNRQLTATAVVPGRLRLTQTDGTVRELEVFIQEGPRFEPRAPDRWDEFAFNEFLRFVAHNPVAFDPAQQTGTWVFASLDDELVFPIAFDASNIVFGGGQLDDTLTITYPGTWLEHPIFSIVGPVSSPRIDNTTTSEFISMPALTIPLGRTVTIDLREGFKTVVDDLGTNLIGAVSSDSDLATFHLAADPEAPLGVNVLRFRGNNTSGVTAVSLTYFIRYFGF